MDDLIDIHSIKDLYERIKPALTSKCDELRRSGINYVKEADIWNYLSEKKWKNYVNLSISQMVSDVFDIDNYLLKDFVLKILRETDRTVNRRETDLL